MRRTPVTLLALLLPLAALAAQATPFESHLQRGNLLQALAAAKVRNPKLRGEPALAAAEKLHRLAAAARIKPATRKESYLLAQELLRNRVPKELLPRHQELTTRVGLTLARMLCSRKLRPLSTDHTLATNSLVQARRSLLGSTRKDTGQLREINLLLIPLLKDLRRPTSTIEVCRETLGLSPSKADRQMVEEVLGYALLDMGKVREAMPHLAGLLRRNPEDPTVVGPVARALTRGQPIRAFGLLRGVIESTPDRKHQEAWTGCLDQFYRLWKKLPRKKDPILSLDRERRLSLPVPRIWGHATWRSGFRVYRDPDKPPGKTYSGRHRLEALLPLSKGWRKVSRPPQELARWSNAAFCFQKGTDGPVLVAYWFAPDLEYWYGTTPQVRGITGKTAKGYSKGQLVSLVGEVCYGKKARERGLKFRPHRSLGLKLGIRSGVTQKQWSRGNHIYAESFFSIGQVTGEILLLIHKKQVKLLEPELRWLFRNIRI